MKTFSGVIQKGTKRATALGFPTLNISLGSGAGVSGIYAALVRIGDDTHQAAAFANQKRGVLEAHILGAGFDLYGKHITIELLEKIRDSVTFEDDEALKQAIGADIEKIRTYFKTV